MAGQPPYANNRETHRIEIDPVRGPLVARLFALYATGEHSLKAVAKQAYAIGLRHPRGDRRMTTSEIHRMLQRLIYTGDFMWKGKRHAGSHTPLITHETFQAVQAVLGGKSRPRRARHPFMGLLTCARCGCAMTAEMKKAKYVYYRCTGFKGACGNIYIRQEQLGELLGQIVERVQISEALAEHIAHALRDGQRDLDQARQQTTDRLTQRHRAVRAKLDQSYENFLDGRISEEFWTRKSAEWGADLMAVKTELGRLASAAPAYTATGERILELAKQAHFLYLRQDPAEQRRLLETLLSNCTFDRGTLCPTYTKPFDVLVRGRETEDWRREWDSNPR